MYVSTCCSSDSYRHSQNPDAFTTKLLYNEKVRFITMVLVTALLVRRKRLVSGICVACKPETNSVAVTLLSVPAVMTFMCVLAEPQREHADKN